MSGMLASIKSLDEAKLIMDSGIDIIDLKNPEKGALGALPLETVKSIVKLIDGRSVVSATVGDLPMKPNIIANAVNLMASTGVDYIKIGFFPDGDWQACIDKLSELQTSVNLIAVLFADTHPDLSVVKHLKDAGFKGVMLDTMDKKQGRLTQIMNGPGIQKFCLQVKSQQMLCGLAGSLRLPDIPLIIPYRPDYMGFRGGLCLRQNRTDKLDMAAINKIHQTLLGYNNQQKKISA